MEDSKLYVIPTAHYFRAMQALKMNGVDTIELILAGALWCEARLTIGQVQVLVHNQVPVREA
jgi:hypothetical protein